MRLRASYIELDGIGDVARRDAGDGDAASRLHFEHAPGLEAPDGLSNHGAGDTELLAHCAFGRERIAGT